jgi:predicted dehydrogenase
MTERTLGVGVIGAGGISRFAHLPNLKRNPRVDLVAVADIDPAKAKQAADDFDIAHSYGSYQELLDDPKVEAVTVTTWPTAHAEPVIAAAKAGKHILCEKPIAPTLAEADAMVDAAEQAGVKFAMGYQHRFGTGLPLVRRLIDEGVVGRPMGMTQVGLGPSAHRVPWFLKKELAGGGVLMDWGIYTAHTILWLMGPVESVYATSAIFRPDVQVGDELLTDVDVEDTVMATMRFRSGAMGSWYAAWAVAAGHHSMSIDGSEGSILTRRESPGVHVFSNTFGEPAHVRGWRHITTVEPHLSELHYRKLAHLVDAVLDDQPLQLTGADGRDALALVDAVYRSADSGQPVDLSRERAGSGISAA